MTAEPARFVRPFSTRMPIRALTTIVFNIPGMGPHTIIPSTPLPMITAPVVIDCLSQPGAAPGTPMIELSGSVALGIGVSGLTLAGGSSLVRGLVINGFPGPGMTLSSSGNTIRSNFIGTDPDGTAAVANAQGIGIGSGATNNVIGGDLLDQQNIIGGNSEWGIGIEGDGNFVGGNVIGVDAETGSRHAERFRRTDERRHHAAGLGPITT